MKKLLLVWMCILLIVTAAVGCAKKDPYEAVNQTIDADGLHLGQKPEDLPEYLAKGEKESCVYGYELRSGTPEVTVGISGTRGDVRRIVSADVSHSICGINPGTALDQADTALLEAGYTLEKGHRYVKEGVRVELLSMENQVADRVSVEVVE